MTAAYDFEVLDVTMRRGSRDDALYAAGTSLDALVAWFVHDGYTDAEIIERVEQACETAREDEE
jgi:hypothetical protein